MVSDATRLPVVPQDGDTAELAGVRFTSTLNAQRLRSSVCFYLTYSTKSRHPISLQMMQEQHPHFQQPPRHLVTAPSRPWDAEINWSEMQLEDKQCRDITLLIHAFDEWTSRSAILFVHLQNPLLIQTQVEFANIEQMRDERTHGQSSSPDKDVGKKPRLQLVRL